MGWLRQSNPETGPQRVLGRLNESRRIQPRTPLSLELRLGFFGVVRRALDLRHLQNCPV